MNPFHRDGLRSVKKYRASIDFIDFNLCWMANAFSKVYRIPLFGPIVVVIAVGIHLSLVEEARVELLFRLTGATAGCGWDAVISRFCFVDFPEFALGLPPAWLFAQWIAFCLLFRGSIRWLRERPLLAGVLGGIGGPLSYYTAARMNVLAFGTATWLTFVVLAGGWAVIVPVFGRIGVRIERDTAS